jgi:hypothetical protein
MKGTFGRSILSEEVPSAKAAVIFDQMSGFSGNLTTSHDGTTSHYQIQTK